MPFIEYVGITGTYRGGKRKSSGSGGTVASGASGSSKGTKATTISNVSGMSNDSDGAASVFSQRSASSKGQSSTAGGASVTSSGSSKMSVGSGAGGIPSTTLEGSAFVVPAQEVRGQVSMRRRSWHSRNIYW